MARASNPFVPPETLREVPQGLLLSEAAGLLDVSPSTLRRYVKGEKLKASKVAGRYGMEYRILPAALKAFAQEMSGIVLSDDDLERVEAHAHHATPPPSADVAELYERIIALTEEAARYKALAEVSDSARREAENQYKVQLAGLQYEKRRLEHRIQTLEAREGGWRPWRRAEK